MATNAPGECSLCTKEYDEEERTPRSLPCAHCFCMECIENLIRKNTKLCPFCRRAFTASSARDIGLNSALLDLLKLMREKEQKGTSQKPVELEEIKKETVTFAKEIIDQYEKACGQINAAIKNNNELRDNVLQDITSLQKEIMTIIKDLIAQTAHTMKYIQGENKGLQEEKSAMESKRSQMTDMIDKLKLCNSFRDAGPLIDDITENKREAQTRLHKFTNLIAEDEKTRQRIKRVAEDSKKKLCIQKTSLSTLKEKCENIEIKQHFQSIGKIEPRPITTEMLRTKSDAVVDLIKRGLLFAVKLINDKPRYAKISVRKEDRVCLHHLSETSPPPDAHLLQHKEVMELVNPTSQLTFLELSDPQRRNLGKIYITLSPFGKRAQQFSMLCTAEQQHTYTKSKVLGCGCKGTNGEYVHFGDYEDLGGDGGRALVSEVLAEKGGVYIRPWLAGTVEGDSFPSAIRASQFYINTKDNPHKSLDRCIGIVEKGLNVLTDALVQQPKIQDVYISDTGIVLPI